ncbi:hypothetical protein LINPERPRIM_LOCUS9327, partial [Linum perenne]
LATFDLQSAANANSKFPTTSLSHSVDLQPSAFRRFPTLFTSLSAAVELQPATLCGSESTLVGSQHPATSLPHSRLCRSPAVQPSFFGLLPILHSPPELRRARRSAAPRARRARRSAAPRARCSATPAAPAAPAAPPRACRVVTTTAGFDAVAPRRPHRRQGREKG